MCRILLIVLTLFLASSCATQLTNIPRERLSANYEWKKNGYATVEAMMEIISGGALLTPGKPVHDITKPPSGEMPIMLAAISEEKSLDDITLVLIEYVDMNLPKATKYYEIRSVKRKGDERFAWKQTLCMKDSKGVLRMFYTKASCDVSPEAAFKEARAYYQQNKDKFSP